MSGLQVMLRTALGTVLATCLLISPAPGQEESSPAPKTVEAPLLIVHSAGVDRLRQHSKTMFSSAGREEMSGRVEDWLKMSLGELKGMDRSRPFGLMAYLKPGLQGLAGIAYAPVEDVEEFLKTLTSGTGEYQKIEGKANRYRYTNAFNQTYVALHRNDYLFLVSEDDETELDRNFPAPQQLVSRLNSRYDLAISLQIKSVPPLTRQMFVSFLQTQSMAELQRKDDEPEAAYRVRKANGENFLELIDKVVNQGEELTLGGRIDDKTGVSEIDLEVAGAADSKFAKFFQSMAGKKSLFANLLQQPSVMTLAVSWQFNEKQRKSFTELFTFAPDEIDRQAEKEGVEGTKSVFAPLFETFLHSFETGHLDGFIQVAGDGPGGFTALGGLRVTGGTNLPKQLHESLKFVKEKFDHNERIAAMELDVERFNGQPIHRIPLTPPDQPGQWMFGEGANLYGYATTQALWVAFGGDQALKKLKAAVEATNKPNSPTEDRKPRVPLVFQTEAKQWVTIRVESGANAELESRPRRQSPGLILNQEMESAFDDQNDGLRVEVRPTDSGARMHWEFQPGWLGLLGRLIARQMEQVPAATPTPTSEPTPTVEN